MLPLFEMMMRAQDGAALDQMARQFNLAQEQVARAMAALTPAFSSGLKRSATNPYDFQALMSAMASGQYAKYFEDMSKAFTPQGVADGNSALEQMFGSKEVSRAIAAQAAQFTGISQEILKSMMPAMADTIMGGLFKQTTGQINPANPFAGTPMGPMVQQWLENTGFAPKPKPPEPMNFFDNPFTQAFQQMMTGAQPAAKPAQAQANPFLDNPWAKAYQEMLAGFAQPAASAPAAQPKQAAPQPEKPAAEAPQPEKKADKQPAGALIEMFNAMFDSGIEAQKSYQKGVEAILEGYAAEAGASK